MATVPLFTPDGQRTGDIELPADLFDLEPHIALMHQAVVATLANQRQGTAATKTRGDVHHTTRKLFRQKGTGRARQGMRSAPHWKGGGVVFGPHPRDYGKAFPKKMKRRALLSAISARTADGALLVVEALGMTTPKTKQALQLLQALDLTQRKVLVVVDQATAGEALSFRNLSQVLMTTAEMLGTYDILNADRLLFTRAGLEMFIALKQQPLGAARWMAKQTLGEDASHE